MVKKKVLVAIFFSCLVMTTYSQRQIKGKIISSEDGSGLPGATVQVKENQNGTITGLDGQFEISADKGQTLLISFIGFVSIEALISSDQYLQIEMNVDLTTLEEIVVVGYGTQRKSDITGSVASIRTEDLNPGPVVSVSGFLQNTAPGVVLTQSSAQPGGGFDVKIRGASSVLAGNGPLYVIDGFPITSDNIQPGSSSRYRSSAPRNPLNGINPQDIVSIEILKDASAAAIYGARGANGVVLITTKRGSAKKLSIDYSSSFSLQQLDRRYDLLTASEYARVSNEVFLSKNPTADPLYSPAVINNAGEGTNWIDEISRLGSIHQHQIGLSGGKGDLKYFVSGNYYKHNGIVDVSALERFGGRVNFDYKVGKLNIGTSLLGSRTNDTQIPFGANGGGPEFAGLFDNTRLWSPLTPVRQTDGEFSQHLVRSEIPNPVSLLDISDVINTNRVLGTFFAEYELLNGLKTKLNVGIDKSGADREAFIPLTVIRGAQSNGEGEAGSTESKSLLSEFTLNYQKDLPNGSSLNILGGSTFQQFDSEGTSNLFINFADQTTNFSDITSADTIGTVPFKERSRLLSYLTRINYSVQNKYLITFSFRADGSTKFGPNNKWGYFPSGAAAWKVHNENFFKSAFIDELKLRASYGQIGNQEIGNKRSQSLYNVTRRTVLGLDGTPVSGLAALGPDNPDLKWETTTQLNIGIDFSVLDSRIFGSLDVYGKATKDVLLEFQLPSTSGFDVVTTNAGSIQNQGVEFSITSRNLVGDLTWTSSFNLGYNKNEWKDRSGFYPEGEQIAVERGPLGGIYGYEVLGLFQSQTEIDDSPNQSAVAIAQPGTFKYKDTNNDGVVTPDDRVLLGNVDPDFTFGLNNSFEYKKFDLTFFFQGGIGREKENFTRAYLEDGDDIAEGFNKSAIVLERWTPKNTSGTTPGLDGIIGGFSNNSYYIEDASFVRLRNITLGYTFGKIKGISNLRLYADVQNLVTITSFKGTDPETDEFRQYPNAKTFTLGLNMTF